MPNSTSQSDASPRKRIRPSFESAFDSESAPVSVVVGAGKRTFHVHEAHLISSSDFFKNALSRDWKEKTTRVIELYDCFPETFKIYVNWLYSGHVCSIVGDGQRKMTKGQRNVQQELGVLAACYTLGSSLQDIDFKDSIVGALVDKMICQAAIYVYMPRTVYLTSSTQSPHQKLALDLALNVYGPDLLSGYMEGRNPADFAKDLAQHGPEVSGRHQATRHVCYEQNSDEHGSLSIDVCGTGLIQEES
ncbi:hypothetical protein E8E11_002643 [Didymella keratinophila]|nr:hypothetical protein E8E11_002643 [Didymella keratinophila]